MERPTALSALRLIHAVNIPQRRLVPARAGVLAIAAILLACVLGNAAAQEASAPALAPAATRPRIGLVLSGGGARGLAHIGVLKVLEELRVPVDYIAATSMGAIVGGLSSSGMTSAEMQERLGKLDWTTMFSDSPPRRDLDIRRKVETARYPIPLEMGFRDGHLILSRGAITGANLELYLHEITQRTDGIANFDRLPTPFRAVATNMVTGGKVVFDKGPLYLALRASMSVPGLFAPLELDDIIYGDGGLVDNLPVDIVRKMGADVVIAVNIGTPLMSREQLTSLVGLTSQTINILTKQNVEASLALLDPAKDVLIAPDLGRLTFSDFSAAPKFVDYGEAAARAAAPALSRYALDPAAYRTYLAERHALPAPSDTDIASIRIEGTERDNPAVLKTLLESKVGEPFNSTTVDNDISRLYGTGDFERVTYRLIDEKNQRDLVFNVDEKPWGPNFVKFGINLSSDLQGDTFFNLLIGHKKTWLNSLGGEWVNQFEIGQIRSYSTEWYQPLETTQTLFGSVYGMIQREPQYVYEGSSRAAEYDVLTEQVGVDLGLNLGFWGEWRIGPQYTHYRADRQVALSSLPSNVKLDEAGVALQARYDRLNDPFFATQGLIANFDFFKGVRSFGSDVDVTRTSLEFLQALPIAANDMVHLGGHFGKSNRRDDTQATNFDLGGFLNLSGLRTDQLSGDYLGFARAVYYHRMGPLRYIGRSWYLGGSLEAGNVWQTRDAVSANDLYKAGSVFVAADTYLGPFYFAYGHTSRGDSSWYLFLGRP